ncbi:MAG: DUF3489 domain-containing protein [Microvirga sp.]|nr:DUF3489 domain-containing protein [Microvirga sp.]
MTTTTKLTAAHLSILNHAMQRPEGRVLPLPDGVCNKGGAGRRALKSLLRRRLLQEELARPEDQEWARAQNGERLTLAITPAGLAAIGSSEQAEQTNDGSAAKPSADATASTVAPRVSGDVGASNSGSADDVAFRAGTKGAAIVELLSRDAGATLPDLMAASGWQAHSVRGFLSGTLKKKCGLTVASEKADGIRRYRIAA